MPSTTRREEQARRTRERLFEAAVEVFQADGVAGASIDEIASRAGVSRGTFYFHFPTKEAVLLVLAEQAEVGLTDAIAGAPDDATVEVLLGAVGRHIQEAWRGRRQLFAEVGVISLRRAAGTIDTRSGPRAALGQRFRSAVHRGELSDALPADALADLCLANVFAVAIAWSADPTLDLEVALAVSTHVFLHGARR